MLDNLLHDLQCGVFMLLFDSLIYFWLGGFFFLRDEALVLSLRDRVGLEAYDGEAGIATVKIQAFLVLGLFRDCSDTQRYHAPVLKDEKVVLLCLFIVYRRIPHHLDMPQEVLILLDGASQVELPRCQVRVDQEYLL